MNRTLSPAQYDISFIVPAYNEEDHIERCLNAITSECQVAGIESEIIVIDNGSTDGTLTIAKPLANNVVTITRTSISTARNVGADVAKSKLLAFIDADVVITAQWTATFLRNYRDYLNSPLFLTGHQYVVRDAGSWIETSWFANINDKLLNGGNIIISTQAFEKINGFDPLLKTGEDYDLCERGITQGLDYSENSGYEAIHLGFPNKIKSFMKREYWHGEGDFRSLSTFLHSPVAILATGYLISHFAILLLVLTGNLKVAMAILCLLVGGNLLLTWKRFRTCGPTTILLNSSLNYIYFMARGISFFRMLKNRNFRY